MLLNKKAVKKNKAIKSTQKAYKKAYKDKNIDRNSILKRNIDKMVTLTSNDVIGEFKQAEFNPLSVSSADVLISHIEKAELTGMSGNGFSTAEKIKSFVNSQNKDKVIIINAVECEPGLIHDEWLISNHIKEIQSACETLKSVLSVEKIMLAVRGKTNCQPITKPDVLELNRVPMKYPMGEEHVLVNQLMNLDLTKKDIPVEKGILVLNVQTVYQIFRILNNCYDGSHFVTVANLKTGEARVAYVNDKTNIVSTINKVFGTSDKYYAGHGAFSAEEISNNDSFSSTVPFACIADAAKITNDNKCRKCGGCSKKCPMGISVRDIVLAKEENANADISNWGTEKCLGCGTCTYFCPASKNPMLYVSPME